MTCVAFCTHFQPLTTISIYISDVFPRLSNDAVSGFIEFTVCSKEVMKLV